LVRAASPGKAGLCFSGASPRSSSSRSTSRPFQPGWSRRFPSRRVPRGS